MTLTLRPYQSESIQAVYDYFTEGRGDAPVVVVPTGGGKSLIVAAFMQRALREFPGTRILAAAHVKELIGQNYQELVRLWPEAPAGIYSAGLGRRQSRAQLLFCGVQSVYRKTAEIGHVDLLMIDEAHLVGRSSSSQYGQLIAGLRSINPYMKIIGLSATPWRMDSGPLYDGKGAIFDGMAYDIRVDMLVREGYLAPLVSKRPDSLMDTTGLHKRGGEYIDSEMSERFDNEDLTRAAVSEIMHFGQDRKAWLVFCIDVQHALHVRDELRRNGIHAETITGETPAAERDMLVRRYKAGEIKCLTSVNVIATGFNAPHVDLIAMMRPTASAALYIQQAGRGLRTAPGKTNCLVLDFAQVVSTHGPVDAINPTRPKKGDPDAPPGDAPAKACPECQSIVHAAVRECPDCGYLFPPPEVSIARTAGTDAIMRLTAPEPTWAEVQDVAYNRHRGRDGKPDSLRAEYLIDGQVAREWVCFEHSGYARQKAVAWWQERAGTPPPATVEEALSRIAEARRPIAAVPQRNGQYLNIGRVRLEVAA